MYRQYPFSEQKQQEAKVKVKETDPTCSQILLSPVVLTAPPGSDRMDTEGQAYPSG